MDLYPAWNWLQKTEEEPSQLMEAWLQVANECQLGLLGGGLWDWAEDC